MSIYDAYLNAAKSVLPEFATDTIAKKLSTLAEHLGDVGSRMNLTTITEPDAVVWLHLIDSLYAAKAVQDKTKSLSHISIADVGSGGGFPALPMAAVLTDHAVTAIDSTEKKCAYIRDCASVMGIDNIYAVSVRAEELSRTDARESFDVVTARAVARLNVLLELCLPLVSVGGIFVAMKGAAADEEALEGEKAAKALGAVLEESIPYTLPGYADDRKILVYRKNSATPADYPRMFAKISKSPL